jgi:hypothetical protein
MEEASVRMDGSEGRSWSGYEEARDRAALGVWSYSVPDFPNIPVDDVVVMSVGPRPDRDTYDDVAVESGTTSGSRWITLIHIGTLEGELEMMSVHDTEFLTSYRWFESPEPIIPVPSTMAGLIGIVSGTRGRDEAPLPGEAAKNVAKGLTLESMEGHVQTELPGSRLFQHYANVLIATLLIIWVSGLMVWWDAALFSTAAKWIAVAGAVVGSIGILVKTSYMREGDGILRMPEGYEEGRKTAAEMLLISSILTIISALTLYMSASLQIGN